MSTRAWLTTRETELLRVPYFPEEFLEVTFTTQRRPLCTKRCA